MQTQTRVILNTCVLYLKAVISTIISLISVPLVLNALGQSDYGLFNLIAGVITMLSFLNASMTVSTQRFMSVTMGENDYTKLNIIYNTGFILHLAIGLTVIGVFELFSPLIFSGFLNISPDRIFAAKIVYQILIVSTFFTIVAVPFNSVLNAFENLTVFAIIHIIESVLKLLLAIVLIYSPIDYLVFYAFGIGCITILVFTMKLIYVNSKYKSLTICPKRYYDKEQLKNMFGFAGWNTIGSVALIGRNQGVAMILNVFYGTIINAAYGIANQINGLMSYLSSTLQQAINPQLMRSEGMNDRKRLIRISCISSKFSVLIICLPAVPLIMEMPFVLELWLKDVPDYTVKFSQLILILTIISQYSSGVQSAIQSVGNVRNYYICVSMLLLMNIPISFFVLKMGLQPYFAIICFIFIEVLTLMVRLLFAKKYVEINIIKYLTDVIFVTLFIAAISMFFSGIIHVLMPASIFRLLLVYLVYIIVCFVLGWILVLDDNQKKYIQEVIIKIKR